MKTRTIYKTWAVLMGDRVVMTCGDRDLAESRARSMHGSRLAVVRHVAEFHEARPVMRDDFSIPEYRAA